MAVYMWTASPGEMVAAWVLLRFAVVVVHGKFLLVGPLEVAAHPRRDAEGAKKDEGADGAPPRGTDHVARAQLFDCELAGATIRP